MHTPQQINSYQDHGLFKYLSNIESSETPRSNTHKQNQIRFQLSTAQQINKSIEYEKQTLNKNLSAFQQLLAQCECKIQKAFNITEDMYNKLSNSDSEILLKTTSDRPYFDLSKVQDLKRNKQSHDKKSEIKNQDKFKVIERQIENMEKLCANSFAQQFNKLDSIQLKFIEQFESLCTQIQVKQQKLQEPFQSLNYLVKEAQQSLANKISKAQTKLNKFDSNVLKIISRIEQKEAKKTQVH